MRDGVRWLAHVRVAAGPVQEKSTRQIEAGRLTGCMHLESDPVGFVCFMHPTTVRCYKCAHAHIETHTRDEEHACDICGDHMPTATRRYSP